MHINICNLPSGIFLLVSLVGSTARKFSRTRSLRVVCGQTPLYVHSTRCVRVKNCRRDTVISTRNTLSSRYYSYFLSALVRDASHFHFLFVFLFLFLSLFLSHLLLLCTEMKRRGERERTYEIPRDTLWNLPARRYTRGTFSLRLRVSFPFFFLLFVKSRTSRCAPFYVDTYYTVHWAKKSCWFD